VWSLVLVLRVTHTCAPPPFPPGATPPTPPGVSGTAAPPAPAAAPRSTSLQGGVGVNYFTEVCSGSEAGSYLRLIDFVYHSALGLRVIKKKRRAW